MIIEVKCLLLSLVTQSLSISLTTDDGVIHGLGSMREPREIEI